MRFLKKILFLSACFGCASSQAAIIRFSNTNSIGQPDTNAFRVIPISTPVNADGTFIQTGIPIRLTPNSSGIAVTNLAVGNYVASNAFLVNQWYGTLGTSRGIAFAVPSGTGTYEYSTLALSQGSPSAAFNVFNYNGQAFSVTASNILYALGLTNILDASTITNMIVASSNAVSSVSNSSTNLLTISTNGQNFALTVLSQTNTFSSIVFTNPSTLVNTSVLPTLVLTSSLPSLTNQFVVTTDSRVLALTNYANVINARVITNGLMVFQENQGGYWTIKTNGAAGLQFNNSTDSGFLVFGTDGSLLISGNLTAQNINGDDFIGDGHLITNITAEFVFNSISNKWRLDATNAVRGIATTNTYIAGSGLTFSTSAIPVTVSVTEGTTNRFALTNYVFNVSNNIVTASNAMSVYVLGLSNTLVLTSNRFDVLFPTNSGSDGQVVTKSGTNVLWSTVTGGSGNGILTNGGSGTNTIITEGTFISTNINFAAGSTISASNHTMNPSGGSKYAGILSGGSSQIGLRDDYSVIVGGFANSILDDSEQSGVLSGANNAVAGSNNVIVGGINNSLGGGFYNAIVGGSENIVYGLWNVVAGGRSNYINSSGSTKPRYSSILGGNQNVVTTNYGFALGFNANVYQPNSFIFSDGTIVTNQISNSFTIFSANGVGINTNNPSGNALNVIGGGISATNFNVQGDAFIYRNTNVVSVRGAGSIGVDGTYVYLGSRYTNYLTGGTITNNAGTWVILTAALQSAYSFTGTSPVSTNWTLGIGSAPSPRTFFGGYLDPRGFYVIGDFDSTNLARKYVHPTNAPADGQFVVASGTDSKWSAVASITNISGNAATATVATNWLGGNIYVSASGSDSASGAVGAPLASVSNALTRISGVGTVIVRGGNYFNQTINLGQFQQVDARIINYRGEEPNFWFGENIPPASFASLSNNIFTTTMSQSFSNALVYYTNRWNLNAPAGKWGCLFQTNMPYGTNGIPNVISPTVDRFTETNRCEHTPLYHANSVADMVGATTNNVWFAQGSTLYVRFANSTAGGLYIQGTNLSDSFCWGVAPPGSSISITGIRTYMARNGFDVTGAAEAKLTGCYAFGSGVSGFLAVNSADTLEYTTNVYTGSIELSGCEAVGSQIFGLLVNALNVDHDRQPWTQAFVHGSSFHDGTRESCTFWGDVRATVTDVSCTYNGVPNGWDIGSGYGLISSAAAVAANGYISISNSQAGLQLGETGRRSLAFVSNSRFYENSDCIRMDDTKDVVFSQNNAYYKIQSPFNLVGVDATVTPEHYVEDSGSFSIQQNSATTGLTISGTGVPTANTLSNPRIEPDRFMALKTLLVSGTASPFGATLGALDVTSSFITVRGTGISYFSGPLGFHTNAFETLPVVGQVGGDAYLFNSNGSPARIRGTAFSTTLVSTNTY